MPPFNTQDSPSIINIGAIDVLDLYREDIILNEVNSRIKSRCHSPIKVNTLIKQLMRKLLVSQAMSLPFGH